MVDFEPANGPMRPIARDALRHIGRDALPQIIRDLKSRDPSLRYRLSKWANDHHLIKIVPVSPDVRRNRAERACAAIGPDAKAAVPILTGLLNEPDPDYGVAITLARIGGSEAVSALINSYDNTKASAQLRTEVAGALGQCPSNPAVVPALVRCLHDTDSDVRAYAAFSLGNLREQPAAAVPALIVTLGDTDPQVLRVTCGALGKFTNEAQSAVGPLLDALNMPDVTVREAAAVALARIDSRNPSTVAKAMPLLIKAISGHGVEGGFRYNAVEALGECGGLGRPALPALLDCLKVTLPDERDYVVKALLSIDPQISIPTVKLSVPERNENRAWVTQH
jgi:HEAT repeat protein